MLHHSVRGVGIRYVIGLTLPITGIVLVIYTIVQLVAFHARERRTASVPPAAAIQGTMAPVGVPATAPPSAPATAPPTAPAQPEHQTASPSR